jgi:hypothetical protein
MELTLPRIAFVLLVRKLEKKIEKVLRKRQKCSLLFTFGQKFTAFYRIRTLYPKLSVLRFKSSFNSNIRIFGQNWSLVDH